MGLIDALSADEETRGPNCSVGVLFDTLPPNELAALQAALDNPARTHSFISRALRSEGHNVSSNTIGRHRRGDCACGPR